MKTNRKKSFSYLLFFLLLLVFLALFAFLGIRSFYRANTCRNHAQNRRRVYQPYIGFYHMYGYVLGSDSLSNLPAASDSDAKNRQGIVMLEVNLQNFSNEDLSDSALSQLDTILSAWQRPWQSGDLTFSLRLGWKSNGNRAAKSGANSASHGPDS